MFLFADLERHFCVSAVACVGDYFPKNSPNYFFASVIVLATVALGNHCFLLKLTRSKASYFFKSGLLIFNPIYYILINDYTWRRALVFTALFSVVIGVPFSFALQ